MEGVVLQDQLDTHHPLLISDIPSENQLGSQREEQEEESLGAMKEMMYKVAAMQPVDIDPATIQKPKRRNVRISNDPQSVAARHRRERISEKIRILQRMVPGGAKMDTATMLDEAIRYVKFLKRQVHELQANQYMPPPVHTRGMLGHFSEIDCPVMSNDTLSITSSSTQLGSETDGLTIGGIGDIPPCDTFGGFTIGGTRDIQPCDTLWFNHSEVIRINYLISD